MRLNVGALFVSEAKTGRGEPVPEIVGFKGLPSSRLSELPDLSECTLQTARRQCSRT